MSGKNYSSAASLLGSFGVPGAASATASSLSTTTGATSSSSPNGIGGGSSNGNLQRLNGNGGAGVGRVKSTSHEFELCLKAISKKDDATRVSGWAKMAAYVQKVVGAEVGGDDDQSIRKINEELATSFSHVQFQRCWLECAAGDWRVRQGMVTAIAEFVSALGKSGMKILFQNGAGIVWYLLLFDATTAVALAAKQKLNDCFTTPEKRKAFIDLCRRKGGRDFLLHTCLTFTPDTLSEYLGGCKKDDLHAERYDNVLAAAVKASTDFAAVLDKDVVASSEFIATPKLVAKALDGGSRGVARFREALKRYVLVLATLFPEQQYVCSLETSEQEHFGLGGAALGAKEVGEAKTLRKFLAIDDRGFVLALAKNLVKQARVVDLLVGRTSRNDNEKESSKFFATVFPARYFLGGIESADFRGKFVDALPEVYLLAGGQGGHVAEHVLPIYLREGDVANYYRALKFLDENFPALSTVSWQCRSIHAYLDAALPRGQNPLQYWSSTSSKVEEAASAAKVLVAAPPLPALDAEKPGLAARILEKVQKGGTAALLALDVVEALFQAYPSSSTQEGAAAPETRPSLDPENIVDAIKMSILSPCLMSPLLDEEQENAAGDDEAVRVIRTVCGKFASRGSASAGAAFDPPTRSVVPSKRDALELLERFLSLAIRPGGMKGLLSSVDGDTIDARNLRSPAALVSSTNDEGELVGASSQLTVLFVAVVAVGSAIGAAQVLDGMIKPAENNPTVDLQQASRILETVDKLVEERILDLPQGAPIANEREKLKTEWLGRAFSDVLCTTVDMQLRAADDDKQRKTRLDPDSQAVLRARLATYSSILTRTSWPLSDAKVQAVLTSPNADYAANAAFLKTYAAHLFHSSQTEGCRALVLQYLHDYPEVLLPYAGVFSGGNKSTFRDENDANGEGQGSTLKSSAHYFFDDVIVNQNMQKGIWKAWVKNYATVHGNADDLADLFLKFNRVVCVHCRSNQGRLAEVVVSRSAEDAVVGDPGSGGDRKAFACNVCGARSDRTWEQNRETAFVLREEAETGCEAVEASHPQAEADEEVDAFDVELLDRYLENNGVRANFLPINLALSGGMRAEVPSRRIVRQGTTPKSSSGGCTTSEPLPPPSPTATARARSFSQTSEGSKEGRSSTRVAAAAASIKNVDDAAYAMKHLGELSLFHDMCRVVNDHGDDGEDRISCCRLGLPFFFVRDHHHLQRDAPPGDKMSGAPSMIFPGTLPLLSSSNTLRSTLMLNPESFSYLCGLERAYQSAQTRTSWDSSTTARSLPASILEMYLLGGSGRRASSSSSAGAKSSSTTRRRPPLGTRGPVAAHAAVVEGADKNETAADVDLMPFVRYCALNNEMEMLGVLSRVIVSSGDGDAAIQKALLLAIAASSKRGLAKVLPATMEGNGGQQQLSWDATFERFFETARQAENFDADRWTTWAWCGLIQDQSCVASRFFPAENSSVPWPPTTSTTAKPGTMTMLSKPVPEHEKLGLLRAVGDDHKLALASALELVAAIENATASKRRRQQAEGHADTVVALMEDSSTRPNTLWQVLSVMDKYAGELDLADQARTARSGYQSVVKGCHYLGLGRSAGYQLSKLECHGVDDLGPMVRDDDDARAGRPRQDDGDDEDTDDELNRRDGPVLREVDAADAKVAAALLQAEQEESQRVDESCKRNLQDEDPAEVRELVRSYVEMLASRGEFLLDQQRHALYTRTRRGEMLLKNWEEEEVEGEGVDEIVAEQLSPPPAGGGFSSRVQSPGAASPPGAPPTQDAAEERAEVKRLLLQDRTLTDAERATALDCLVHRKEFALAKAKLLTHFLNQTKISTASSKPEDKKLNAAFLHFAASVLRAVVTAPDAVTTRDEMLHVLERYVDLPSLERRARASLGECWGAWNVLGLLGVLHRVPDASYVSVSDVLRRKPGILSTSRSESGTDATLEEDSVHPGTSSSSCKFVDLSEFKFDGELPADLRSAIAQIGEIKAVLPGDRNAERRLQQQHEYSQMEGGTAASCLLSRKIKTGAIRSLIRHLPRPPRDASYEARARGSSSAILATLCEHYFRKSFEPFGLNAFTMRMSPDFGPNMEALFNKSKSSPGGGAGRGTTSDPYEEAARFLDRIVKSLAGGLHLNTGCGGTGAPARGGSEARSVVTAWHYFLRSCLRVGSSAYENRGAVQWVLVGEEAEAGAAHVSGDEVLLKDGERDVGDDESGAPVDVEDACRIRIRVTRGMLELYFSSLARVLHDHDTVLKGFVAVGAPAGAAAEVTGGAQDLYVDEPSAVSYGVPAEIIDALKIAAMGQDQEELTYPQKTVFLDQILLVEVCNGTNLEKIPNARRLTRFFDRVATQIVKQAVLRGRDSEVVLGKVARFLHLSRDLHDETRGGRPGEEVSVHELPESFEDVYSKTDLRENTAASEARDALREALAQQFYGLFMVHQQLGTSTGSSPPPTTPGGHQLRAVERDCGVDFETLRKFLLPNLWLRIVVDDLLEKVFPNEFLVAELRRYRAASSTSTSKNATSTNSSRNKINYNYSRTTSSSTSRPSSAFVPWPATFDAYYSKHLLSQKFLGRQVQACKEMVKIAFANSELSAKFLVRKSAKTVTLELARDDLSTQLTFGFAETYPFTDRAGSGASRSCAVGGVQGVVGTGVGGGDSDFVFEPACYLLESPADGGKNASQSQSSNPLGVPKNKFRRWELNMKKPENAHLPLPEIVEKWMRNFESHFEGVEDCMICYSVVCDGRIPDKQCPTCANKFHAKCLKQWFDSSGKIVCPLCKQPWS